VGVGYHRRRARDPQEPSAHLGEIAVDEYATSLAGMTGPTFVPLVLFEGPSMRKPEAGTDVAATMTGPTGNTAQAKLAKGAKQ
jgi:hypothetical protein